MSSRFHNKFHRHNHHTLPTGDPQYPDASYDPIASPDSPFQGDFILNGSLSAANTVTADLNFRDTAIKDSSIEDMQTAGEFLKVTVEGVERYIRLWATGTPLWPP